MRRTFFNKFSQYLCFTDNVNVGRMFQVVVKQYIWLKREAKMFRLKVNISKSKYLLAGGTDLQNSYWQDVLYLAQFLAENIITEDDDDDDGPAF